MPKPKDLSGTYFLRLTLDGPAGVGQPNFYWLSAREDVLDWKKTKWFYTPTKVHGDLTALARLPPTTLSATAQFAEGGPEGSAQVVVENTGTALAFQVHLRVADRETGEEVLPVFWEDNYFALMPGEKRTLRVSFPRRPFPGTLELTASAWNAPLVRQ